MARVQRRRPEPSPYSSTNRLGGYACGGSMHGGTDHIRDPYFGSSVQHSVQTLENFRIGGGVIGFGVLFRIPQTDCDHVGPTRDRKSDLVLESLLLPQDGKHIAVEGLSEIAERVGLQMERYIASVHSQPPWGLVI